MHQYVFNDVLDKLEADPHSLVFLEKLGLFEAWKAMPPG